MAMEKQPILKSLVESSYRDKIVNIVVAEKTEKGIATVLLESTHELITLYWNKQKQQWQDVLPAYLNPNIISTHYQSVV
jgi:hypothetical protein